MQNQLTIANIVLTLVVLGLVIMLITTLKKKQDQKPNLPDIVVSPVLPHLRHKVGGCAGTRYGCCPNGRTPRANPWGSNC
jgi:hypothetical protein